MHYNALIGRMAEVFPRALDLLFVSLTFFLFHGKRDGPRAIGAIRSGGKYPKKAGGDNS